MDFEGKSVAISKKIRGTKREADTEERSKSANHKFHAMRSEKTQRNRAS